ncbi:MAG: inositol monophosphatase family protein [Microthrixaceae bacterium]
MTDEPEPADGTALVELALGWAREAGDLTLGHFRDPELTVDSKGDGTPVTVADREAEALLRDRISSTFPSDGILGEEQGGDEGTSGMRWVIDPIDGTKAFSHGVATYSNLLALTDDEGTRLGIINLPALGETLWAIRGSGCWFNGRRMPPANPKPSPAPGVTHGGAQSNDRTTALARPLAGRILCVSGFHDWTGELHDRVADAGVLVRTWGDAYGYALVATGRADAMFDPELEWWDLAAPSLVVREAGGVVTSRSGSADLRPPPGSGPYAHSAIASRGGAHQAWLDLLS